MFGLGLFTLRGEPWRHSRALLRPQFSREQISDMELEERHANALSTTLQTGPDGWTNVVDLQPMFLKMTLELMTEFLYGQSLSKLGQQEDAPDTHEFGYHFDAGKAWLNTRMSLGKWHWLVNPPAFSRHCRKVHAYVDYFVEAKLKQGPEKASMLQLSQEPVTREKFVLLNELAKHTRDPLEIRSETLNVLSAGRDTTASLLSWIFYFLARYPAIFNELRTTILAEFGTESSDIDFPKLRSCKYLQHCINETLRMTAIVPILERESLEDTILPRGGGPDGTAPVFIQKGQRVLISTYALQQRSDIWECDPEVFRPERWENRKAGMEFVPFGGGPRKCVGRELAPSLRLNFYLLLTRCRLEQFALTEASVRCIFCSLVFKCAALRIAKDTINYLIHLITNTHVVYKGSDFLLLWQYTDYIFSSTLSCASSKDSTSFKTVSRQVGSGSNIQSQFAAGQEPWSDFTKQRCLQSSTITTSWSQHLPQR